MFKNVFGKKKDAGQAPGVKPGKKGSKAAPQGPPIAQVQWIGTFWNDGKKFPFSFEHMEISPAGAITGYGTDTQGKYTLGGTVKSTGQVNILKNRVQVPVTPPPNVHQSQHCFAGF
jgi:hypothetical protein